ncbi:MAG TPA: thiamine pyrophosphate-dependent enzyme [Burkholderiales bacterium]|nr:thiamine pyrophosphate-dependent enzyme [Burkholderiales bacterium]
MLDRRQAVATLLRERPEHLLVVPGLGSSTYDVAAAGDDPRNFYLWGAMGGALSIGLGLALAQPAKRVLVVTGDGEMLMGMGSLATVGAKRQQNLAVAVIDNEAYGETGGQASHTRLGVDLAAVALACGFKQAHTARTLAELQPLRDVLLHASGPVLAVIKTAAGEMPRVLPERDGHLIRARFRAAVVCGQS